MKVGRLVRHLTTLEWQVRRAFPAAALAAIEQAIAASEAAHRGQICFAVEGALDSAALLRNQAARERALEVFSHLRVWDTEHNNGVLIYVLLADRDVEIVADRGIHHVVETQAWEKICHTMERTFGEGKYADGVVAGIRDVTEVLAKYFPATATRRNELPDKPHLL